MRAKRLRRRARKFFGWLFLPAFALAVSACEKVPSEIRIKGPLDAVESTQKTKETKTVFPTFEEKNETIKLRVSSFDDKGLYMGVVPVKWDSSDRSVASIDQSGVVTILGSGKATITAKTTKLEKELSAAVELDASIVDKIRWVDPPESSEPIEMPMGEIKNFKAEVLDDRGNPIADAKIDWNASSWAVTVTPTGEVEARAIGSATLTAEAKNGERVRHDISVVDWVKPKKSRRR